LIGKFLGLLPCAQSRIAAFTTPASTILLSTYYSNLYYYHPIPRRDSFSRPIAPVSFVAGGDHGARACVVFLLLISSMMFKANGKSQAGCGRTERIAKTRISLGLVIVFLHQTSLLQAFQC
jgi:hypothetical protein